MPNDTTPASLVPTTDLRRALATLAPFAAGSPRSVVLEAHTGCLFLHVRGLLCATVVLGQHPNLAPVSLPIPPLRAALLALPGDVALAATTDGLTLTATDGTTATLPTTEAPRPLPFGRVVGHIKADVEAVVAWLAPVVRALPCGANRRMDLDGVYVDTRDDAVLAVTTDGTRLSAAPLACTDRSGAWPASSPKGSALIPTDAARAILALARGRTGDALLQWDADARLRVLLPGAHLTAALRVAEFPTEWRGVLPAAYDRVVDADRDALAAGFRRVLWASPTKDAIATVAFRSGSVGLSTSTPGVGRAATSVPAGLTGPDLVLGVNARFMLDALAGLPAGPVVWESCGVLGVMRLTSRVRPGVFHIVMPVRLG